MGFVPDRMLRQEWCANPRRRSLRSDCRITLRIAAAAQLRSRRASPSLQFAEYRRNSRRFQSPDRSWYRAAIPQSLSESRPEWTRAGRFWKRDSDCPGRKNRVPYSCQYPLRQRSPSAGVLRSLRERENSCIHGSNRFVYIRHCPAHR